MKQMKRILSLVLAFTMLVSMFSVGIFSTAAETATYRLGDADLDGVVNIFDVTHIQKGLAKYEGYMDYSSGEAKDTIDFAAADVDVDGYVNIFDVTYIQRHLASYDDGYGIGEEKTFGDDVVDPTIPTTPTEDESVEGYYLVGNLNGVAYWDASQITPDRKLKDADGDGIYTLDWTFYDGDEIKVVAYDGTSITRWYKDGTDPDGDQNYKLTDTGNKTGLCTVSFDPTGSQGWSYIYFTVQQKTVEPTQAETVEPTQGEATGDQPTQAETDAPTAEPTTAPVGGPGYYLVGQLNGANYWFVDDTAADRKLTDEDGDGIYTLDWTFYNNDEIKVVAYDGTTITRWYKGTEDGDNPNYTLTDAGNKTGLCTVSFDPTGSQGWSYTYLTVQKKTVVEPTQAETEAPTQEETEAPTQEPTQAETDEPTAEPTQGEATDDDPTTAPTQEETDAPTDEPTVAPKAEAGYYLVGTLNTANYWFVDDTATDRMLTDEDGDGIYTLDWTFYNNDEIKVVAYDGTTITRWYKGTEDGDNPNYTLTDAGNKTGLCTVSFDPTGSQGWSYTYLTVQKKTVVEPTQAETDEPTQEETEAPTQEPTEEETEAPTDEPTEEPTQNEATDDDPTVAPTDEPTEETEAPTAEPTDPPVVIPAGYYLVGTLDGADCWFVDETSADRMLVENESNEGEYMLDWTFVDGDEIKVAYFDGTEITDFFKGDGEPVYTISAIKAGENTIYFRPEGNEGWSYTYFTVPDHEVEVDYHLVGYINGADYGIEGDSSNVGDYKFVDGKLTATFTATSYVMVKTSDNAKWYMTDGWAGEVSSATLYNTNNIGTEANKLYVPGGVEVTFTLVDNGDDTFTLSYVTAAQEETEAPTQEPTQAPTEEEIPDGGGSDLTDPTEDETEDTLPAGYYLVGKLNGVSLWDAGTLSADRQVKDDDGDGIYTLYWTFYGGDELKVVYFDGTSITQWYGDGANYSIGATSNKTGDCLLKFDPTGSQGWSYTWFTVNRVS